MTRKAPLRQVEPPSEELEHALAEAQRRIHEAGLRVTRPRMLVLELLTKTRVPLTPYRIHEQLIGSGKKIDVVSVYRVLENLQEIGLIHRIGMAEGYMACALGHEHSHEGQYLLCNDCGQVVEIGLSPEVVQHVRHELTEQGFEVEGLTVELSGKCTDCKRK